MPLCPERLARFADIIGADLCAHPDLPVRYMSQRVSPRHILRLLKRNLERADEFARVSSRLGMGYVVMPVAQGITPDHYVHQVTMLANSGFHLIAIGGLAHVGPTTICTVLNAVSDVVCDAGARIHLFGVGRVTLLDQFSRAGILASHDCSTPLDDSHRDSAGLRSYYYHLDRGHDLHKIRLADIWSGVRQLPPCDCPACRLGGNDIVRTGNVRSNRLRDWHNAQAYVRHTASRWSSY